jgi:hypothetical protein
MFLPSLVLLEVFSVNSAIVPDVCLFFCTYWQHKKCIMYYSCLLFVILPQNFDMMKAEYDTDVLSQEDTIYIKSDEVIISSAFAMRETKPEVSHVFRCFHGCSPVRLCFLFLVQIVLNITHDSLICINREYFSL